MASPDSQLDAIITQLEIELAKITTANNYHTNVKKIYLNPDEWMAFAVLPSILIDYGSGDESKYSEKRVEIDDTLRLRVAFKNQVDSPACTQIAKFLTDLRHLLYHNCPNLTDGSGNKLVTTVRISSRVADHAESSPLRILAVNLEVDYDEAIV